MSLLPTFEIHSRQLLGCGEKVRMRGLNCISDFTDYQKASLINPTSLAVADAGGNFTARLSESVVPSAFQIMIPM
jgi:hypothetical protein